jgi:uncharacterized membrane protein YdjX (TVP38/TMEM64 family)
MEARDNNNPYLRRNLIKLAGLCLVVATILAVWRFSAFGEYSDPARLGALLDELSTSPWAGLIVVGGFVLGSFVVFPVTAMIAATGIALGPVDGLLWASVGSMVGATVNYGLARMLPDHALETSVGPWVRRMAQRLERGGIVPVMVARTFPFAPFTLINIVAGGARIPFRDFVIGTVLGMGPVIAALTILGDRLRGAWEAPTALNLMLLVVAIVAWFLLALSLQSLSNRWLAAR